VGHTPGAVADDLLDLVLRGVRSDELQDAVGGGGRVLCSHRYTPQEAVLAIEVGRMQQHLLAGPCGRGGHCKHVRLGWHTLLHEGIVDHQLQAEGGQRLVLSSVILEARTGHGGHTAGPFHPSSPSRPWRLLCSSTKCCTAATTSFTRPPRCIRWRCHGLASRGTHHAPGELLHTPLVGEVPGHLRHALRWRSGVGCRRAVYGGHLLAAGTGGLQHELIKSLGGVLRLKTCGHRPLQRLVCSHTLSL
jgi:hypothetical protein